MALSDLESGRSSAVAEGGDAAVVSESAPVEDDTLDPGGLGPLADERTDPLGGVDRPGRAAAQFRLGRRGRGQRPPGGVVDDLGVDVLVGPEHGQARPLGGAADPLADPAVALDPRLGAPDSHRCSSLLLPRLAGLAQDALAGVADALALVGLGLANLADVGRHL